MNASAVPQISPPAPLTVKAPAFHDALPGRPVAPTLLVPHGKGTDWLCVTVIESKVAVVSELVSWLVTARPANANGVNPGRSALPIVIQELPSIDTEAVNVWPLLASRSHV